MRTTLLFVLVALVASCGNGDPTSDISAEFEADVCAAESGSPTPFVAAANTATAHVLGSTDTPYQISLPPGADGFVGIHVSEIHTTIEIIVKHSGDAADVTMSGAASDLVYDMGPVSGTTCTDLYYYKLHADEVGDYELRLPSNAANSTWLAFKIVQVGHDI